MQRWFSYWLNRIITGAIPVQFLDRNEPVIRKAISAAIHLCFYSPITHQNRSIISPWSHSNQKWSWKKKKIIIRMNHWANILAYYYYYYYHCKHHINIKMTNINIIKMTIRYDNLINKIIFFLKWSVEIRKK